MSLYVSQKRAGYHFQSWDSSSLLSMLTNPPGNQINNHLLSIYYGLGPLLSPLDTLSHLILQKKKTLPLK